MNYTKPLRIAEETAEWYRPHDTMVSNRLCRVTFGKVEVTVRDSMFVPNKWDIEVNWSGIGSVGLGEAKSFAYDLENARTYIKALTLRFIKENINV